MYETRTPIKKRRFSEVVTETVKEVGKAASDVYGAVKTLVPGVALRQGLEKAKSALKKATRR